MKRDDAEFPSHVRRARRELLLSLCLFGLVVAAALAGLAFEGNWRKFVRVGLGFAAYGAVLLTLLRLAGRAGAARAGAPFWVFAAAGACAELASGWLRPGAGPWLTLWVAPAAGLLVGGAHWLALGAWRPLRERITAGSGTGRHA